MTPGAIFSIGDVRDATLDTVKGFDAVIHLAGLSNDPLGDYNPSLTEDINHQGSARLARLAKEAGVERFLFASSCSNYGGGGQDFLDETARFNPVTPYGVSKVEVERAVGPMADDDFSPTFLRASTAYGMSPRIRFDLVVNTFVKDALMKGRLRVFAGGEMWRPLVDVADVADAAEAAPWPPACSPAAPPSDWLSSPAAPTAARAHQNTPKDAGTTRLRRNVRGRGREPGSCTRRGSRRHPGWRACGPSGGWRSPMPRLRS